MIASDDSYLTIIPDNRLNRKLDSDLQSSVHNPHPGLVALPIPSNLQSAIHNLSPGRVALPCCSTRVRLGAFFRRPSRGADLYDVGVRVEARRGHLHVELCRYLIALTDQPSAQKKTQGQTEGPARGRGAQD